MNGEPNWMSALITEADRRNCLSIDTDANAEDTWVEVCREGMEQTLFPQVSSWINGANVPGKPRAAMFYMGGMAAYMAELNTIVEAGYPCFRFS